MWTFNLFSFGRKQPDPEGGDPGAIATDFLENGENTAQTLDDRDDMVRQLQEGVQGRRNAQLQELEGMLQNRDDEHLKEIEAMAQNRDKAHRENIEAMMQNLNDAHRRELDEMMQNRDIVEHRWAEMARNPESPDEIRAQRSPRSPPIPRSPPSPRDSWERPGAYYVQPTVIREPELVYDPPILRPVTRDRDRTPPSIDNGQYRRNSSKVEDPLQISSTKNLQVAEGTVEGTYRYLINSRSIMITPKGLTEKRDQRGKLWRGDPNAGNVLHDLLAASFVPLTEPRRDPYHLDPQEIQVQAEHFLSAFSKINAIWEVDVKTLPNNQGRLIHGLTEFDRRTDVMWRFLRFRFPFVRFEWHVETPYSVLATSDETKPLRIQLLWKAWTHGSAASALVAYGFCTDTLIFTEDGYLLIEKRHFEVANVVQPELMTPTPFLAKMPALSKPDDFIVFSTSQTVIQTLRSSQRGMTFLVALSALVTSLTPIVHNFSAVGGWVLVGIGITAAVIAVLSMALGWVLGWIEANAAKHRQIGSIGV